MAQFAPLIPYVGAIVTAVGGLVSARGSYVAGKEAQHTAKLEARQEVDQARGREIERKRNLLRALATQNAAAGAQGVAFSGGKAAIAQADINEAGEDLAIDRANLSRRAFALRQGGKSAKKQGYYGAASSLLDTAGNVFGQL